MISLSSLLFSSNSRMLLATRKIPACGFCINQRSIIGIGHNSLKSVKNACNQSVKMSFPKITLKNQTTVETVFNQMHINNNLMRSYNRNCMQQSNSALLKQNLSLTTVHIRFYSSNVQSTTKATKVLSSGGKGPLRGIQKDIFPLSTKRIVRRKKTKDSSAKDQEIFDVTAYATCEDIDLESLNKDLKDDGLYCNIPLPEDCEDALHMEAFYRVDNEPREILFFREGAIVFWNVPKVERNLVLRNTRKHQDYSYDSEIIEDEQENVQYIFTDTSTTLVGDEIQLQNPVASGDEIIHQLEKYTFSNVLALSVKLAIWEASLEQYVESIEYVLQDLKAGKKLKISRQDVLRKTGELLTLRHLINLSSDLLDIPDFYWNRDQLESLYRRAQNQLNIGKRVKVMNDKLNHCCELTELLREQLNDKHHTHLEWLIIFLIAVEVMFEILHMAGIK